MTDLAIVLVVLLILVLLWRGPKTLPRLGEALGRGVREARSEASKSMEPDEGSNPDATPDMAHRRSTTSSSTDVDRRP